MNTNMSKYLPIGAKVSNKYEVIEVLGEDDFEILYLVKDFKRRGSFFVLKELFLESFSFREEHYVTTIVEARGVFNKRKKEIIEEIKAYKLNGDSDEIKIYGYEEDNDTVYTIMDFSNNASLEKYLEFTPKDENMLPSLDELVEGHTSMNILLFRKILFAIVILSALAFYAYKFFMQNSVEEDSTQIEVIETKDFLKLQDKSQNIVSKVKQEELNISVKKISVEKVEDNVSTKIKVLDELIIEKNIKSEENTTVVLIKAEDNVSSKIELFDERTIDGNISKNSDENLSYALLKEDIKDINETVPIQDAIKTFLDAYMETSSTALIKDTLVYYDKSVKRYFRFRNATHRTIEKSQARYNQKWTNRRFKIVDFKILKSYEKNNLQYHDLTTTTLWNVSNKSKKLSGKSKGFMTLKELEDGFKITVIYTLK